MNLSKPTIFSVLTGLLLCGNLFSDTVYLRNNEKLEGQIVRETKDSIHLLYQFSEKIKDVKIIPKSDIVKTVVKPADHIALDEIKKQLPLPDLSNLKTYDEFIKNYLDEFRINHPQSLILKEVEKIKSDLWIERSRIAEGYIKYKGKLIQPEEYQTRKNYFDSIQAGNAYKKAIGNQNYIQGMRLFEEISYNYSGSTHYPELIKYSKDKVLPEFQRKITNLIEGYPKKKSERDRISKLETPNAKDAKKAIMGELAKFKTIQETEKATSPSWNSYYEYDVKTLEDTLQKIEAKRSQLDQIDLIQLVSSNEMLEKARNAMHANKTDEAKEWIKKSKASNLAANKSDILGLEEEIVLLEQKNQQEAEKKIALEKERQKAVTASQLIQDANEREEIETPSEEETNSALSKSTDSKNNVSLKANMDTATPGVTALIEEPSTPLWRKLLIAIIFLLSLLVLALKIFGIGNKKGDSKKNSKEEKDEA